MTEITVVLADDHPVVRHGLRAMLESEPGLRIVGEASDGLETVRLIEQHQPRIAVVDLMMSGLNGLEVTRQAAKRSPTTRVIILSVHDQEGYVAGAFRSGGAGYVLKDSSVTDLVRAVRDVAEGRRYLSPKLSERAIEAFLTTTSSSEDPFETLSLREREVLILSAEGRTSAEIASRLVISPRTVEVHRARIMRKLDLHSQADLIRYALKRGLLPME